MRRRLLASLSLPALLLTCGSAWAQTPGPAVSIPQSAVGAAGGVAALNGSGLVPVGQSQGAAAIGGLAIANNLSDVSAATARVNLGLTDQYNRLTLVPIVPSGTSAYSLGITDQSAMTTSNALIPRYMSTTAGEFALALQGAVPVTTNSQSYEKAALYVRVNTADPSDYTNSYLRDAVGVEAQSSIAAGNMLGRAWAYDAIVTVSAGADGYASGMELGVQNSGSDQPATGQQTSKNGIHLVGGGTYGGTAGIVYDGKWHDGEVCTVANISGDCLRVWNGVATFAEITPAGAGNFTSMKLIGQSAGSTATFVNFCYSVSGTGYLASCLYGANNAISAQYAAVGGNAATDKGEFGSAHFASSNFGHGYGDSQWGWRVLSGTIPAAGGTVRLNSQNGTLGAANSIPIGAGIGLSLDCKLVAHKYGGQDTANWSLDDALFDEGSTVSTARLIAGSWTTKNASSGATGLTPSVAADTTLGAANISVTASAANGPWDVTARCFTTESR